ncbi:MAG: DUF1573 domain-containing protein, partial [Saprospiraceae bacterium]|nr:DUF1573 domain-containing protein [Saprospiraceae bacterium]
MKKVMWTLALLFSVSVLSFGQAASQKAEGSKMTKQQVDATKIQQVSPEVAQVKQPVSFQETTVDYGTLEQGGDPYRVFTFTNNSDQPLIIKSARGSCGCT